MIEIMLPYAPTVNHYKAVGRLKTTKTGKIYQEKFTSAETKRFYFEVFLKCRAEGVKSFDSATISVEMDVYPPDARRRDIDNVIKPTLDSLQKAGIFNDDYQVALLTVKRCSIIPQGQIFCRITKL
jgi:crossover junction endodeoxyribonuclease RusA